MSDLIERARLTDKEIAARTAGEGFVNFYNREWEVGDDGVGTDNGLRHLSDAATAKALWTVCDSLCDDMVRAFDLSEISSLRLLLEAAGIQRPTGEWSFE